MKNKLEWRNFFDTLKINFTFKKKFEKRYLVILFFIAFFIRFIIAFNNEATGDAGGWRQTAKTAIEKKDYGYGLNPYDGTGKELSNGPPLIYHYVVLMGQIYYKFDPLGLPDYGFYKLLPILCDSGIILLIYYLAKKFAFKSPIKLAVVYAFHPIALYISAWHGQRDSIWLFFVLLSILILFSTKSVKWIILASLFFALGTSFKVPSIFLLPVIVFSGIKNNYHRILFFLLIPVGFFIFNLPEMYTYFWNILKQVFLYKGHFGWWGLSGIIGKIANLTNNYSLIDYFNSVNTYFSYGALVFANAYFILKKTNIIKACLGILMAIYIFLPAFAFQYLIWPLPFIVMLKDYYPFPFKFYSIYGTFFAMNFYGTFGIIFFEQLLLNMPRYHLYYKIPWLSYPMDFGIPIWIFSIYFFIKLVRSNDIKIRSKT